MKRLVILLVVMAVVAGAAFASGEAEASGERSADVSFLTSGQGGTFYVAGTGIASLTSREVEGLQVNAEVTRGVVENARLMSAGESMMGFSYGSVAYNISRGLGQFENQEYDGLRAVALIHHGALNIVTLEGNNIDTVSDLAGKSVSVGPPGSGSAAVTEQFLTSVGLWDEIDRSNLSFQDSAASLRDGHIDAFFIGGATPVPVIVELEASTDVKIVEVDEDSRAQFLEEYPYHVGYTIEPGAGYSSVTEPIETVGYTVLWVAREDAPEWVVYEMLKVMFSDDGREYLQSVQTAFREMQPGQEHFSNIELPYHPGAERYYQEAGLID